MARIPEALDITLPDGRVIRVGLKTVPKIDWSEDESMDDLAEFLLSRIAEDEAVALEASWRFAEADGPESVTAHIARHDPARVLAECDTKRQLVFLATASDHGFVRPEPWGFAVLRLLAMPYAHHPYFNEEWRA